LAVEKCLIHQRIKQENQRLQKDLQRLTPGTLGDKHATAIGHSANSKRWPDTDELTGLSNRAWFNLMLNGSWAEATRKICRWRA